MKKLKNIGLFIALAGFGLLLSTFFLDEYTLTPEVISKMEAKFMPVNEDGSPNKADQGYQRIALFAEKLSAVPSTPMGKFAAISQLNTAMDAVDSELATLREQQKANGEPESWGFDPYSADEIRLHTLSFAMTGTLADHTGGWLGLILAIFLIGAALTWLPMLKDPAGIKNNGIFKSALTKKWGALAFAFGALLFVMYIFIYWYPYFLVNFFKLADPVAMWIKGTNSDRWFWYGFVYTVLVLVMGARMIIKYRHVPYQIVRTLSVTFFQVCFAFTIPNILESLNMPSEDLKNIWPLDYDFFFDYNIQAKLSGGSFGIFLFVWGLVLALILMPLLTYFFGKRWYCSWVCGCGGLAETAGDPWRQVSDKSTLAWKIERITIHSVLIFAVVMTIVVVLDLFTGALGGAAYQVRSLYSFFVGSILAGVIGTGLYPVLGNRPWCRFFCPLAAILGIVQRFQSRFRITTNGGQCISCGNCSTYCEQGIDVKSYAQRGENIVRASCVGCGVCSAVCPRGVLKLENGDPKDRSTGGLPLSISKDEIKVNQ